MEFTLFQAFMTQFLSLVKLIFITLIQSLSFLKVDQRSHSNNKVIIGKRMPVNNHKLHGVTWIFDV